METEIKFVANKRIVAEILKLTFVKSALRQKSMKKRSLVSVYYDSENLDFFQNGMAYRVRSKGDGTYEATIKLDGDVANGGLSSRMELTQQLETETPLLTGFKNLGLVKEPEELAPEGVKKLFSVEVRRVTYLLDYEGAVIELAVDSGNIFSGDLSEPVEEIELELVKGERTGLFSLAAALAGSVPLFPEIRSKYERGMALNNIYFTKRAKPKKTSLKNGFSGLFPMLLYRGGLLTELQKSIKENGIGTVKISSLKKQLLYLRSFLSFISYVSAEENLEEAKTDVASWMKAVKAYKDILYAEKKLSELRQKEELVTEKGALYKAFLQEKEGIASSLVLLAESGSLTSVLYRCLTELERISAVKNTALGEKLADYICRLYELKDVCPSYELPAMTENCYYIAKSIDGKEFSQAASELKAYMDGVAAENTLKQLILSLNKKYKGKNLNREVGILLGYLVEK